MAPRGLHAAAEFFEVGMVPGNEQDFGVAAVGAEAHAEGLPALVEF